MVEREGNRDKVKYLEFLASLLLIFTKHAASIICTLPLRRIERWFNTIFERKYHAMSFPESQFMQPCPLGRELSLWTLKWQCGCWIKPAWRETKDLICYCEKTMRWLWGEFVRSLTKIVQVHALSCFYTVNKVVFFFENVFLCLVQWMLGAFYALSIYWLLVYSAWCCYPYANPAEFRGEGVIYGIEMNESEAKVITKLDWPENWGRQHIFKEIPTA